MSETKPGPLTDEELSELEAAAGFAVSVGHERLITPLRKDRLLALVQEARRRTGSVLIAPQYPAWPRLQQIYRLLQRTQTLEAHLLHLAQHP